MASLLGTLSYKVACLTAAWLAYSPSSIISTDRPVHLIILTLLCTSVLLLLIRRCVPSYHTASLESAKYERIPLQDLEEDRLDSKETTPQTTRGESGSITLQVLIVLLAIVILTSRIEIQRRIFLASECSTRSVAVFLPFILSVYDAICHQKHAKCTIDEDVDNTAYEDLLRNTKSAWLSSRWRYVPAAFILSFGCYLVGGLWLSSQSTVICPLLGFERLTIPRLQVLALFLDTFIVIIASNLAVRTSHSPGRKRCVPASWVVVLMSCSIIWAGIGVLVYRNQPENMYWLLFRNEAAPMRAYVDLVLRSIFMGVMVVSFLLSLSQVGVLHIVIVVTALCTIIPGLRFIWTSHRPYPPISSVSLTWSFVMMYVAWSLHNRIRRSLETTETSQSKIRHIIVFFIFIILIFPGLLKTNSVHFHPIDLLMYNAQKQYTDYLNTAARSTNLRDAVESYQTRYRENPPPGFDIWFEYARNRSVWVTDEFDQIYNDLLPFRSTSPADIRRQTWEDVSNPWNEISGISIRNGEAKVQENVLPTHRWMLEGVVEIIEKFSQYLPDMDLAFNLNDECRIALKHDNLKRRQSTALTNRFEGSQRWSDDRSLGWRDPPLEPTSETVYENWSFQNTFLEWGTAVCPPSIAQRSLAPLYRSQICSECVGKHSLGQFVANWTQAGDPCHQPDLAYLHGLYLSPAAFKATHQLRPIFSQSKAHGYNDILYPSAWNYQDKAVYAPRNASGTPGADDFMASFQDPPFAEKESVLYWRGATTEGVSDGHGAWRGMTRQRMVHMADNSTNSDHDQVTLLLPDQRYSKRYTYVSVPATSIPRLGLVSSMYFVDGIARCGGVDCLAQEQEFASALPADFQGHWQYKYLMDMDGAGFSGRFLPFLQSRSLPFKSALFQNWYDSRLIPWLHFVPQDIRLHGLWSTLAYFQGANGTDEQGRTWNWQGHEREAVIIANSGREWAGKALTKADMEVYMFRLLLEWARLTDDFRDKLGFQLD